MSSEEDRKVPDHESDPAHTPGYGWGEEGGASHLGPATHIESGRPDDDDEVEEELDDAGGDD